jgi:hypothetical protein
VIVDADPNDVGSQIRRVCEHTAADGSRWKNNGRCGVHILEVQIEVFRLDRPVSAPGIFKACSNPYPTLVEEAVEVSVPEDEPPNTPSTKVCL